MILNEVAANALPNALKNTSNWGFDVLLPAMFWIGLVVGILFFIIGLIRLPLKDHKKEGKGQIWIGLFVALISSFAIANHYMHWISIETIVSAFQELTKNPKQ